MGLDGRRFLRAKDGRQLHTVSYDGYEKTNNPCKASEGHVTFGLSWPARRMCFPQALDLRNNLVGEFFKLVWTEAHTQFSTYKHQLSRDETILSSHHTKQSYTAIDPISSLLLFSPLPEPPLPEWPTSPAFFES